MLVTSIFVLLTIFFYYYLKLRNHPSSFILSSASTSSSGRSIILSFGTVPISLHRKVLQNIVEIEENAGNQHFLHFQQCLYLFRDRFEQLLIIRLQTAFEFGRAENLFDLVLYCTELTLSQTSLIFMYL